MNYKSHQFVTSNWKKEFMEWFPDKKAVAQLCFVSVPPTLEAMQGYIYVLRTDAANYLLGFATESGSISPSELFPWKQRKAVLYESFQHMDITRGELWRCVWARLKVHEMESPHIFTDGEDMQKAYRKWERERYCLWLCYRETGMDMMVLVRKEVALLRRVSLDLFCQICTRLSIPRSVEAFTEYLHKQYNTQVSFTSHEILDGLVLLVENSIRKKWTKV